MKYVFFLLTPLLLSAEKSPFSIADYYRVKSPQDIAVCPADPDLVLFSVTSSHLEKGSRETQIFQLRKGDLDPVQITFSGSYNGHPMWSRDGKKIYFLSSRKGGMQVWVMSSTTGEPRQVSHFETGVEQPQLHPDDQSIIFASSVYPECMADSDCNRDLDQKMKNGPVQAHLADNLLYRHWTSYRDFKYSHLFRLDLSSGQVTALTHGKLDFPAYGGSFDISPDGRELVVVGKDVPNPEISTNTDLYLLRLDSNQPEPECITSGNKGFDGDPIYSPNGRYIAFRSQKRDGYESDLFQLKLYDRKTQSISNAMEPFDNWVQMAVWAPDSTSLFFNAHEKGYFPIYQLKLGQTHPESFMSGVSVHHMWAAENGLWSVQSSVGQPREIYWQAWNQPGVQAQTSHLNRELLQTVDIRPAESIWIKSPTGRQIQTFIVKPPHFDPAKTYPLILNVHGGPQYQWADTFRGDWQVYPGAGYVVAFPNPHGSSGYGQAFTEAISGDYNGKVMKDIAAVTDHLANLKWIDSERMGAMGWSWGGYAMMWLEGNTTKFKALSAMMGIYDLSSMYSATEELWFVDWDNKGAPWQRQDYYRAASPSSYVEQFSTPCLVITGERDYRVPYTQSMQFFTALQRQKVPSRLIIFSNDGHWPDAVASMPVYYNAHLEWFHTYLGGGKAPYDTEQMIRNQVFNQKVLP